MARAAVGQICSTADYHHNLRQCKVLVDKASSAGAKTLFLPEASDYIASSAQESLSLALPVIKSPFVLGLQDAAKGAEIAICVGIHEPAAASGDEDKKRLKNTLIWIDASGKIVQRYQKLHLFDVSIDNGPNLKESDSVERGPAILPPFSAPELPPSTKVGMLICFDLRFPEPALALRRQGATLFTYPSAFTVKTGIAHWETLLRARAIETQSYVVAAAQVGDHNEKRRSYGHSLVVDPWGEVKAELGGEWTGEPEMAVFDIDEELVAKVRREVPLLRRTDVYPEV